MGDLHCLDVGCADASIIVTSTAAFLIDCRGVFGVLQRGVADSSGTLLQGLAKAEPVYPILNPKIQSWVSGDKK